MKCTTCNRLSILYGSNLYQCPFCGRCEVQRAGLVVPKVGGVPISVPKQSHPKHE